MAIKTLFSSLNTMNAITIFSGCFLMGFNCYAASPSEICYGLNAAIDRNIVEIAVTAAGEIIDKSATQQGARLTQINNRLSTIMINIQLQAQNRCPPRENPIDASIYPLQASQCLIARLKGDSAEVTLACDFKAWNTKQAK